MKLTKEEAEGVRKAVEYLTKRRGRTGQVRLSSGDDYPQPQPWQHDGVDWTIVQLSRLLPGPGGEV